MGITPHRQHSLGRNRARHVIEAIANCRGHWTFACSPDAIWANAHALDASSSHRNAIARAKVWMGTILEKRRDSITHGPDDHAIRGHEHAGAGLARIVAGFRGPEALSRGAGGAERSELALDDAEDRDAVVRGLRTPAIIRRAIATLRILEIVSTLHRQPA